MDYVRIYKNIISNAKKQHREKGKQVYYEKHHIMPDFMFKRRCRKGPKGHLEGDPNERSNIVLLTPKEHFLCHFLLYKIYKDTRYGYSCGAALSFFSSKVVCAHPRYDGKRMTGSLYAKARLIGIGSISKSNKGFFSARSSITGEYIGRVSVNDIKVLSGEYVHHSKGSIASEETKAKMSIAFTGLKNANAFVELTKDIAESVVISVYNDVKHDTQVISTAGHVHKTRFLTECTRRVSIMFPHRKKAATVAIVDRLGTDIVSFLNDKLQLNLTACGAKVKFPDNNIIRPKKNWVTNGIDSYQVLASEYDKYINDGWRKGRCLKSRK